MLKSESIKDQITALFSETLEKLVKDCNTQNYNELLNRWRDFHNIYLAATDEFLQQWAERCGSTKEENGVIHKIEAESVVVEVIDQNTGILFRRNLPINYLENDNGLILSGETMEGKSSQIAFLSETAVNRIKDLTGKGLDAPRCDHDH